MFYGGRLIGDNYGYYSLDRQCLAFQAEIQADVEPS